MRKVVIARPGGYERLRVEAHPDPVPGDGEVLVRAEAIGVNYADCIVRMGLYESARKYVGWPITPGFELAGTVAAVGPGVGDVAIGARVIALVRFGAYASHVVVPRHQLFRLPHGMSAEQGASLPAVFLTAWYALFDLARPRRGATLLVHSAAGGVGGALLQLGKHAGHTMVGVVGASAKVEPARAFGATHVIDKSTADLWSEAERHAPDGYDAVFDANGPATLRESYRHLRPRGRLVVYGFHSMLPRSGTGRARGLLELAAGFVRTPRFSPLALTGDNKSVMGMNLSYLFEEKELLADAMDEIFGWLRDGVIQPLPVTSFRLEDVAEAHRALESGLTTGKLALLP